jgi:hypothetical protein
MMTCFQPLIICDNQPVSPLPAARVDFLQQRFDQVFWVEASELDDVIFQIIAHPKVLSAHLQRIYLCYQQGLSEDLCAALLDLLIVLEGKGRSLSQRMILGAKSKLAKDDYARLKQALTLSAQEVKALRGNACSLFSLGLVGTPLLVVKKLSQVEPQYDPLEIARDYIAYSQLDAAIDTLEKALLLDMNRQALHEDLIELYRVTQHIERFEKMYAVLSKQMPTIPSAWLELKGFFNEG